MSFFSSLLSPFLIFLWLESCFAKVTLGSNLHSWDCMEWHLESLYLKCLVMGLFRAALPWMWGTGLWSAWIVFRNTPYNHGQPKRWNKMLSTVGRKTFWVYYFLRLMGIFLKNLFYFFNYHLQHLSGNWIYLIWDSLFL